jgi:uncharacterized repeat protein (TIGR01451 family)
MKKIYFFIILFALQLAPSKAQWVTIPDANFVTKLTQLYPSCMNGNQLDTTCAGIVNETALNLYNLNISDLTGVRYFVNLTFLNCSFNQLTSLPNLPNNLQQLNCGYNNINSLSALQSSLQVLYCNNNGLTSLPALPNNLITLDCYYNSLTSLPNLPSSLEQLNCYNNDLTSLPALPNSLLNINCSNNQLTNLPILPGSINYLSCSSNQLTSLPTLPNSLLNLSCSENQLPSLPALPSSLAYLYCSINLLTNLPALPGSLILINCSYNQLTSLPSLPDSIGAIACQNNQLLSLPALPNSLDMLDCNSNQLTSLPALPNQMNTFKINNNNIFCLINLPQITVASNGNISNNPLTCVPNQTNYSLGLPLCMDNDPVNNPNYCIGVANITGYIYKDLDTNCSYANNDWNTQNIPVKVYDGQNNMLAMSYTVNGAYSFTLLQPDTFIVKIDDATLPFSMDCGQANNQNVALDSANQTIQNINFPVVCDTAYDIKVNSVNSQGWVFPGQQHTLNTNITNNISWYNLNCGSSIYSGSLSIEVAGPVTYVAAANNALTPTVNGNTFTYNITDFNTLTPQSFGLKFQTDTTAQTNDQICVHVEINPTPLDVDTTNNVYDFCYNVVNSYDPNMKEVYPVNVLPDYDDWFTYTIHFQNTGNAPAFNIRLRDTLDANLDINSFEVRGYSHPAQISINGNILTVRFNNIMLPDSTTDYEGSMGYFQYRLKPLPNLPNGTQIENTAYIYFDYNAPIITNTTQNNFDMTVRTKDIIKEEEHYVLYPNPSAGIFMFKDNKSIKTVEVFNMMGELILSQGNAKIINLQAYPKGIYVARVNGTQVCRLVKE